MRDDAIMKKLNFSSIQENHDEKKIVFCQQEAHISQFEHWYLLIYHSGNTRISQEYSRIYCLKGCSEVTLLLLLNSVPFHSCHFLLKLDIQTPQCLRVTLVV
jgi:hypothetical protein